MIELIREMTKQPNACKKGSIKNVMNAQKVTVFIKNKFHENFTYNKQSVKVTTVTEVL